MGNSSKRERRRTDESDSEILVEGRETTTNPTGDYPNKPQESKCAPHANITLILLTGLNLLNYCDRFIPSSTKENLKTEWKLSDAETGLPVLVFLLMYMISSPLFGTLADCGISRKLLIIAGIIFWSISASSAFWAVNFGMFLASRVCVGLGEAAFSTIAPSYLCDFFPPEKRNRALVIFYISMPVGAAIGFAAGGGITDAFNNWRYAYLITGVPGIIISLLLIPVKDPGMGYFDPESDQKVVSWPKAIKYLLSRKIYPLIVIGTTLQTWGVGGLADWLPAFYHRQYPELDQKFSALVIGGITSFGGLVGILLGGLVSEYLKGKTKHPFLSTVAISGYTSVIFMLVSIYYKHIILSSIFICLAEIGVFMSTGPTITQIANMMPGKVRTRALGLHNLIIHALGDAISPTLLGLISDETHNLTLTLAVVPLVMSLGAIIFLFGSISFDPNESQYKDLDEPKIE